VSYDTWENEFGYTSAEDWNLDGQADLRTTSQPDRVSRGSARPI
jgi:hypothetical protein